MRIFRYLNFLVVVTALSMGAVQPAAAQEQSEQIRALEEDKAKAEQRLKMRVEESLQLIQEIENQKKALMEAAELMRKYKKLKKQHKALESERERLVGELDGANSRIAQLSEDLESRIANGKALKAAQKELKAKYRNVEGQLRDATAEGARLSKSLARSQSDIAELTLSLAALKDSKKTLKSELRGVEEDYRSVDRARTDQARQINIITHELELARAENERLVQTLKKKGVQEAELIAQNKGLRKQVKVASKSVDERTRRLGQLSNQNRELEQQVNFARKSKAGATDSERVLRDELSQQVMITENLIAENERANSKRRELQVALDQLSRQLEFAQAASEGLEGRSTWRMQQPAVSRPAPQRTMVERQPPVATYAVEDPAGELRRPYAAVRLKDWIKRQDPSSYSLQLITLPDEKFVAKFFEMYPLDYGERAFYVSHKGGKQVFNIIFGVFESEMAAQQGMQRLPEDIKKKHPLILEFASIQKRSR